MSEVTKRLIDKYYERVKRILQESSDWDKIVRTYPEGHLAVRRAVKEILKRGFAAMHEGMMKDFDPETLDWKSMFKKMKDHDNVESFIEDLKELELIPKLPEEDIEDQELATIEQQVREAFGDVRVLRSEDYEKLMGYRVLVDRLRKRLRRLREEKKKLEERIEEAFRKAAEEREKLLKEIERLKKARITMVTVKFLKDMPSFVGVDEKTYGPYKAGDIASLPEANAAVLIEKGIAERWVAPPVKPPAPPKPAKPPKPKIPPPRLLPPVPETCPIDGTPLSLVHKIPIAFKLEHPLTVEEEYWRARLGLPIPTGKLQYVEVPPTMRVWMCERGHFFERDVRGRLIQRTPEFIYRKILREKARLERAERIPTAPPPRRRLNLQDVWWEWLEREKGITREEFMRLSEDEKNKLRREFGSWYAGALGH